MTIEKQHITCADIEFISDNIIQVHYKDEHYTELSDVIEMNNLIDDYANGRPIYTIVNNNHKFTTFSKEAQRYLAKDAPIVKNKIMRCSAVIVDNLPSRIIARFLLNFYKPRFHMKIFSDYDKAMAWVQKLIVEEEDKSTAVNNS